MKSTMLTQLLLVSSVIVIQAETEAPQIEEPAHCEKCEVDSVQPSEMVTEPAKVNVQDIKNLSVLFRIKRLAECTDEQWELVKSTSEQFDTVLKQRDEYSADQRAQAVNNVLVKLIEMNSASRIMSGEISVSLEQVAKRNSKIGFDAAEKSDDCIVRDYVVVDSMLDQQDWVQLRNTAIELVQDSKNVVPATVSALLVQLVDVRDKAATSDITIVEQSPLAEPEQLV